MIPKPFSVSRSFADRRLDKSGRWQPLGICSPRSRTISRRCHIPNLWLITEMTRRPLRSNLRIRPLSTPSPQTILAVMSINQRPHRSRRSQNMKNLPSLTLVRIAMISRTNVSTETICRRWRLIALLPLHPNPRMPNGMGQTIPIILKTGRRRISAQ